MTRLVLDTNVWLDMLVFDDPATGPIRAAAKSGRAGVFIDEACEMELARVLGYRLSGRMLDLVQRANALACCRSITRRIEGVTPVPGLPRCADPDDQKFLELAQRCRADSLITRDTALLTLDTRKSSRLTFRIVSPQGWAANFTTCRLPGFQDLPAAHKKLV
jgi:putative PIN family toxin of toxin-antitoxin system